MEEKAHSLHGGKWRSDHDISSFWIIFEFCFTRLFSFWNLMNFTCLAISSIFFAMGTFLAFLFLVKLFGLLLEMFTHFFFPEIYCTIHLWSCCMSFVHLKLMCWWVLNRYEDQFAYASFDSAPTADSEIYSKLNAADRDEHERCVRANHILNDIVHC